MKHRISRITAVLVFGLGLGLGLSQTAVSQVGSEQLTFEEIVVTAQKREQSLQDVPISITTVQGDFIQEFGIARLQDLTALIPNVSVTETATADFISIRGINSGVNIGFEQSVGTFIDGVYFGRDAQSRARFLDMERLEVLRGPQSTYFGNNTIGGALSFTTRKPRDEFEGYVRGFYGPDNEDYDLEIAAGGPVTDTFGLRGAVKFVGYEGFMNNQFQAGRPEPDEDSQAYRITGVWTPTERFDATLKAEYAKFEQLGVNKEVTDCPPPPIFAPILGFGGLGITCGLTLGTQPNFEDQIDGNSHNGENGPLNQGGVSALGNDVELETNVYALTMNYEFAEHTLTSITGYNEYDLDRATDIDHFPVSFIVVSDPTDFDQFSQELRFASPTDRRIEYLAGVYYQTSNLETNEVLAIAPLSIQQYTLFDQEEETTSVFGSLTWNITDAVRTTIGGRYTNVDKDVDRCQTLSNIPDGPPVSCTMPPPDPALDMLLPFPGNSSHPLVSVSRSDDDFTPSINVQWDVTDDAMLYASYADGFKAGGFDQRASDLASFVTGFEPESVDAFEIGAKTNWLDGALNVNIAAFYSEYDNLQVSEFSGTGIVFFVRNAASAISQGVELETRWALLDSLTASLAVSYLDATYDEWLDGPCNAFDELPDADGGIASCRRAVDPSKDVSGQELIYAPEWSGNFILDFVYPISSRLRFLANLTVAFTTEYSTRADNDPRLFGGKVNNDWDGLTRDDSAIKSDPFAKLDLRLGLGGDRWEVAVIGKNITDETTVNLNNRLATSGGSLYRTVERDRYFLLQASYGW